VRTLTSFDRSTVQFPADGLVPAVVQDVHDGRVLMLGYMDREALSATLTTREVHFHSRSRGTLWRKGETSGNVLRLVDLAIDCDGDAILVTADPAGPTCHRGTRSCFDDVAVKSTTQPATVQGFGWLETLWATIESRAADRPEGSYTTSLLDGGVNAVARKVTEEATEVLLAAKDDAAAEVSRSSRTSAALGTESDSAAGDRAALRGALASETADLLYHTLVLLAERDLPPADVIDVLRSRHR
jgi:phosphoribosyl-AMP cyclohydrolase / phosphoribosyl-ATP pyrophosphohydrolase